MRTPDPSRRARFAASALRFGCRIGYVIVVAILGIVVALLALPDLFGMRVLVIETGSMEPNAPRGSAVLARSSAAANLQVGDMLLRSTPSGDQTKPTLHRVTSLRVVEEKIVVQTKGDANRAADPGEYVVPDGSLVGVVVLPLVGRLLAVAATPTGWILSTVLPGAVVCARVLTRIWAKPSGVQVPA